MNSLYKKYVFIIFILVPKFFYGMMPVYQNSITNIQDIQGSTTYTLVITCSQREPIVVYAPSTYQESLDSEQITFFMPHTTLAPGVEEISDMVEIVDSGVSIFLQGKLKKKLVTDYKIYITIEVVQ